MPWPKPNEDRESFISRCMASPETHKTFPDEKQRAAFCYSRFKEHAKSNLSFSERMEEVLNNKKDQGYGFCPKCDMPGIAAERRIDGYTSCEAGHKYLHSERVYKDEK